MWKTAIIAHICYLFFGIPAMLGFFGAFSFFLSWVLWNILWAVDDGLW
jgi:hypothetical protein